MEYTNNIERIMSEKGMPTLKAIAGVFELNPVRIYSVAKQPKEGVVYDAKVFNWDAIERFITRRLDADKGLGTLEDVIDKALEIDEVLKQQDGRRAGNRGGSGGAYGVKIEVDGQMIAARRYANFEMENNQMVTLRKDPEVYAIVMQTASHTVLRPLAEALVEGAEPVFKGNDIKVISNGMLNMRGTGPSALAQSVEDRFSGVYAQKLAEEAQAAADKAREAAEAADAPDAPWDGQG